MSPEKRTQPVSKKDEVAREALSERFERSADQVAKRARLLLNPLKEHRFLTSLGIIGMIAPRAETLSYFNAFQGHIDAKAAFERDARNPGIIELEVDSQVETGITHLRGLIQEHGEDAVKENNLFANIQTENSLRSWVQDTAIREPLAVLNFVIREELFREGDDGPAYSPDEQKALFAAAVGFAQVKAVKGLLDTKQGGKLFEEKETTHKKRFIRDKVLGYAMNVLTAEGRPELFQYLAAQKSYQMTQKREK